MKNIARPITLSLSDKHLEMMVKNHLLKDDEVEDISKIAKIAQQVFDEALGLPEASWHEWDDWAKGLE
jgi:DNA-binding transcriptional regulator YiaG